MGKQPHGHASKTMNKRTTEAGHEMCTLSPKSDKTKPMTQIMPCSAHTQHKQETWNGGAPTTEFTTSPATHTCNNPQDTK
eukprot:680217-Amphidinium_carterae.1